MSSSLGVLLRIQLRDPKRPKFTMFRLSTGHLRRDAPAARDTSPLQGDDPCPDVSESGHWSHRRPDLSTQQLRRRFHNTNTTLELLESGVSATIACSFWATGLETDSVSGQKLQNSHSLLHSRSRFETAPNLLGTSAAGKPVRGTLGRKGLLVQGFSCIAQRSSTRLSHIPAQRLFRGHRSGAGSTRFRFR